MTDAESAAADCRRARELLLAARDKITTVGDSEGRGRHVRAQIQQAIHQVGHAERAAEKLEGLP